MIYKKKKISNALLLGLVTKAGPVGMFFQTARPLSLTLSISLSLFAPSSVLAFLAAPVNILIKKGFGLRREGPGTTASHM